MRVSTRLSVAAAVVLAVSSVLAVAQDEGIAKIAWETDLLAARARAAEEGKPMLVMFRCRP